MVLVEEEEEEEEEEERKEEEEKVFHESCPTTPRTGLMYLEMQCRHASCLHIPVQDTCSRVMWSCDVVPTHCLQLTSMKEALM